MMPNLLQYPVALFGALRAGYVVVNCNPLYSPRELHHQLADSGAEAIVVLENFAQTLEKAIERTEIRARRRHRRRRPARRGARLLTNFVVRQRPPRRAAVAAAAGGAVQRARWRWAARERLELPKIEPGGPRVPAIHRRHDRRAEGRDADASQHDRQPAAGSGLDRAGRRAERRDLRHGAAALSRVRPDA